MTVFVTSVGPIKYYIGYDSCCGMSDVAFRTAQPIGGPSCYICYVPVLAPSILGPRVPVPLVGVVVDFVGKSVPANDGVYVVVFFLSCLKAKILTHPVWLLPSLKSGIRFHLLL